MSSRKSRELTLFIVLFILFTLLAYRRGWLSDDAHITFRVVDNLVNGYGLRWNILERVQVYTHPLWMMVLSAGYFLTRDFYWMPIYLGIGLTLLSLGILARWINRSLWGLALGLVILILSQAFVDYTTSGLENPLSHLITVIFFAVFFVVQPSPGWLGVLSLTASLGMVNRLDLGIIFIPALLWGLWKVHSPKGLAMLAVGQIPLVLWILFSLWYYGFPFPNTAYAKLNTGLSTGEYILQGLHYLQWTLRLDPVTWVGIVLGLLVAAVHPDRRLWLPMLGALAYLGYVVSFGGDFMGGRFLTVPLLCGVVVLARAERLRADRVLASLFAVVLVTGLVLPPMTTFYAGPLTWEERQLDFKDGITDERAYYAIGTSVLNFTRDGHYPSWDWAVAGRRMREFERRLIISEAVGMIGFFGGPNLHVVDPMAITDPLLAHLPAKDREDWRIGHFTRVIPAGYVESVTSRDNQIQDPRLAEYYDHLTELTRGDLFSPSRLVTIARMNLGMFDDLIDRDHFRHIQKLVLSSDEAAAKPKIQAGDCDDPDAVALSDASEVEIVFSSLRYDPVIEVSLSANDQYRLYVYSGDDLTWELTIPEMSGGGRAPRRVFLSDWTAQLGYTRLKLYPISGKGPFCIGYLVTEQ